MKRNEYSFSTVVLIGALSYLAVAEGRAQKPTDATFAFTADVHVSFNGTNDTEGITWQGGALSQNLLIADETAANLSLTQQQNACTVYGPNANSSFYMTKDLCNQIQHVRKLNALPLNSWNSASFTQNGHSRKLASSGKIADPLGVIIGGDMTDCGGGVNDGNCDSGGYNAPSNGAQILAFQAAYDRHANVQANFNGQNFLRGLQNPDADVPLKWDIYPGYGNHDLQFSGSYMQTYMSNWVLNAFREGKINPDVNTQSYSWDWGKLHIVNVGVYPGCGVDGNLDFDQNSMNWLKNDLGLHASDGRPVIIVSHFGFDSYSLGSAWWGGSNRVAGLNQLWQVLQPYDVIGYFHGHNHGQTAWYPYPTGSQLPYDIFLPGAGFLQDFAVVHVTDKSMDVMITADQNDFDNGSKNIQFGTSFTKTLVQPPQAMTPPAADQFNELSNLGFVANQTTYLLGVNAFDFYTLRTISAQGRPTVTDSGLFAQAPNLPKSLCNYSVNGQTHILAFFGNSIADYTLTGNKLALGWQQSGIPGISAIVFSGNGMNHLLVDDTSTNSGSLDVYEMGASSANLRISLNAGLNPSGLGASAPMPMLDSKMLPFVYQNGNGIGVIRYSSLGQVEYDGIYDLDGAMELHLLGTEQWPMGTKAFMVPMVDGTSQIFTISQLCLVPGGSGGCEVTTTDSPYYVRTFLADSKGTEISWRGVTPGLLSMPNISYAFAIGNSPSGATVLGAYSPLGLFGEFALQPNN